MLKHIPNALTLTRLILAPVIAWLFLTGIATGVAGIDKAEFANMARGVATYFTAAAVFFVVAALTDFFDGIAARAFNAHSKLGRIIDPIADKALVGLPLIAVALIAWQRGDLAAVTIVFATAVIVVRDVTMTVIRLTSPDGEGARVSSLAKWKTALELVVVGSLLVVSAINAQMLANDPPIHIEPGYIQTFETVWVGLLVITAALSAYTGWQYLRPAKKG
ncbi:MAG: CDP-alcohol phosphatidyltransferase family protein [Hyphomonadaceae bacterium]